MLVQNGLGMDSLHLSVFQVLLHQDNEGPLRTILRQGFQREPEHQPVDVDYLVLFLVKGRMF